MPYDMMSKKIKELMESGKPLKEAIASAMAHAHRSKMMGSMEPEDGSIGGGDENSYAGEPVYTEEDGNESLSEITLDAQAMAKGLQAKKMKANNNSVEYSAGDMSPTGKIKSEGLTVEHGGMTGNKPDRSIMVSATGEPMSEEVKAAIMARKAKRRYS